MIKSVLPPKKIVLHKISKTLEVVFSEEPATVFPASWLRARSPSADNRVQLKSANDFARVSILAVESVGNYAVKLLFSDGHSSGIYSWDMLFELSKEYLREVDERT